MLRRLDLKSPWRSLDQGFWPDNLPLGRQSVVYGHNGSGKSTVSELLLSLSEGSAATDVIWEDDEKRSLKVGAGGSIPSQPIAVYTRKWVDRNLSAFLDGESASAIVTLGREAIEARDEQERLANEVEELSAEASDMEEQRKGIVRRAEDLAREVQDKIVEQLRPFDNSNYTKSRYSLPKVQEFLRNHVGQFPDSDAHAEALKRLGEAAPTLVDEVPAPPVGAAGKLDGLTDLLAETPTRMAIEALDGSPDGQAWVEQGIELHQAVDRCLFCAGEVTSDRRAELARHFDESWLQIRVQAKELLELVNGKKESLADWSSSLPPVSRVVGDLQPAYADAVARVKLEVDERTDALEGLVAVLGDKVANPSCKPQASDWSVLLGALDSAELVSLVDAHNDHVRRYEEVTKKLQDAILDHLIGSKSEPYRELEEQASKLDTKLAGLRQKSELAERRLQEVRQAQFTTKTMADTLTLDLARVYGKDHLQVAVADDGKSYTCKRGDQPAKDLSDGERMTLSLLYFLRKLGDERVAVPEPRERIVVIDDPSSSLDREALFATHQWLYDTLNDFGQYIILTHDFGLLRLFIKSQKNSWGKTSSKIKQGDAKEIRFPRVAFLEIYATSVEGERRSKVGELPQVLMANTSEYVYLFSMVMAGVADPHDHERLFLLPNAARRVLEVFASYKAPHQANFLHALKTLIKSQEGEPHRDVYDFCNRFSHGEGSASVDVLDARVVHTQIRRCMEFMRAVDSEHFELMCKAARLSPSVLP